jgi:hypothetical protein
LPRCFLTAPNLSALAGTGCPLNLISKSSLATIPDFRELPKFQF